MPDDGVCGTTLTLPLGVRRGRHGGAFRLSAAWFVWECVALCLSLSAARRSRSAQCSARRSRSALRPVASLVHCQADARLHNDKRADSATSGSQAAVRKVGGRACLRKLGPAGATGRGTANRHRAHAAAEGWRPFSLADTPSSVGLVVGGLLTLDLGLAARHNVADPGVSKHDCTRSACGKSSAATGHAIVSCGGRPQRRL